MDCLTTSALIVTGLLAACNCEYSVTIYPQYLAEGGQTHFEADRWNGHNVLDDEEYIAPSKSIGTKCCRWIKSDFTGGIFHNTPEDPNNKGYPDPSYFNNHTIQQAISELYAKNIKAYGNTIVMTPEGTHWPDWMNGGLFPSNLDAATDLLAQMLGAIQTGTGGILPPHFEVINEPGSMYQQVNWTTIIEFHKMAAAKLKAMFPDMKVGGPCHSGIILQENTNDFQRWNEQDLEFLDMSFNHLDFFSFHPYNWFYSFNGSHNFTGPNEARLVAIIDLVSSYSTYKIGRPTPLIFSEYGVGRRYYDSQTPLVLIQWAYAYTRNGFMSTMLNHRGVIDRAVAFLISLDRGNFTQANTLNPNLTLTYDANTYRFWKPYDENQQFLRVQSEYSNAERTVSPLALVDPASRNVTVFLHNYNQSSIQVKLNFTEDWVIPQDGFATCLYFDSTNTPQYVENKPVRVVNNVVTLYAEMSCSLTFQTDHDFSETQTVRRVTSYSPDQVIAITNNTIEQSADLEWSGSVMSAELRLAVSTSDKYAVTLPMSVAVNGFPINKHYSLHDPSNWSAQTLWDVYIYSIPPNAIKRGSNSVHLVFGNFKGYVSSVALDLDIL